MELISIRQYFKGYYFKCSTEKETVALIPALHCNGKKCSASLQVVTEEGSFFVSCSRLQFGDKKCAVEIGDNRFSEKGISLNLTTKGHHVHGKLKFGESQKIRYDIMGPFRHIPCMQCRHSIISMRHSVEGKIRIDHKEYHFADGIGYIEGDSGYSFPREYLWTQCHFANGSLMLSVADIPLLGFHFKGIIGIIMIAGREYRIATYLGAGILSIGDHAISVRQGRYTFSARLIMPDRHRLYAPVNGSMSRIIHESASCEASYQFTCDDQVLLEFTSAHASFEYEFKK